MRLVIVESPYAAPTAEGIALNVAYARACMRDCLNRDEAPYASHLLYTQPGVLRDEVKEERSLGMRAGFAWHAAADGAVVYTDLGISSGMERGIARMQKLGKPVEMRTLSPEALDEVRANASEPR